MVMAAVYWLGVLQFAVSRVLVQLEVNVGVILFEWCGGRLRFIAEVLCLNGKFDWLFDVLVLFDGIDFVDLAS